MEYSNLFVCLMGMSIVFFGLVCLVFLTMLVSTCLKKTERAPAEQETREKPELAAEKELLAALIPVLSLETKMDAADIRITSIRKL